MAPAASSSISLILLFCCILVSLPLETTQFCIGNNFTANSTYGKTRNLILASQLPSNVTANGGFYAAATSTATAGNSTVSADSSIYVLGLCRGDLSNETCFSCINSTSQAILEYCPTQKGSVDWGDLGCIVRYSDKSFFGAMDTSPALSVFITRNITLYVDEFDQALTSLVESLIIRAAAGGSSNSGLKFATGRRNFAEYQTVYGAMQCTPDVSSVACSNCLRRAVDNYNSCCKRKLAVTIRQPSCLFQYDSSSQFYQSTAYDIGASPPPPAASPPPVPTVAFAPPPLSTTTKEEGDRRSRTSRTAIIVVVPILSILLLLVLVTFGCAIFRLRKRKDLIREEGDATKSENEDSLRFDFATIRAATNDFSISNKLGQGGFGVVYKGKLSNGQEIAVKRLTGSSNQQASQAEFKNEIVLMARLQHRNIVRLVGFCFQGTERLLICEFVLNASLDRFLFDPIKRLLLNWETRYAIILGIARGLLYLHEESQLRIIHRDLKAGNVLLDGGMNPKIADFGMARLFVADQSQGNTKKIAGTLGYMPPEYAKGGKFSVKTDVFSFGVLILEILSGKKNGGSGNAELVEHLPSDTWKKWKKQKALSVMDETIRGGSRSDKMRCIEIGLLCVQENAAKRPTMASVVSMLSSFSITLPSPSKPAFFMETSNESVQSSQRGRSIHVSVNEASITDPCPR